MKNNHDFSGSIGDNLNSGTNGNNGNNSNNVNRVIGNNNSDYLDSNVDEQNSSPLSNSSGNKIIQIIGDNKNSENAHYFITINMN